MNAVTTSAVATDETDTAGLRSPPGRHAHAAPPPPANDDLQASSPFGDPQNLPTPGLPTQTSSALDRLLLDSAAPEPAEPRRPPRRQAATRARLGDLLRAFGLRDSAERRVEAAFPVARPANDVGRRIERIALADRFGDAFEAPSYVEPVALPRLRKTWLWRVDPDRVKGDAYDEEMRRYGIDPERMRILRRLWRADAAGVEALRPELEAVIETAPGATEKDRARIREIAAEIAALPPDGSRRDELLGHLAAMLAEMPARRVDRFLQTIEAVVPPALAMQARMARTPDRGPGGGSSAPPPKVRSPEDMRRLQDDLRSFATKQPIARRNAEAFKRLYPDGPPDPRITPELVGHVLYGEVDERGKAVGAHFGGRFANPARMRITHRERLPNGVVRATIDIKGPDGRWIRKDSRTALFPDTADPARVLAETVPPLPRGARPGGHSIALPGLGSVRVRIDQQGGVSTVFPEH